MSITIQLKDYINPIKRINKDGSNCYIGDIITWSSTKNQKDMYGKITQINKSSVNVDLYECTKIYNKILYLDPSREKDSVTKNVVGLNTRNVEVIKSNTFG